MLKIYGIKNCDSVKKSLKFITDKNIKFEFIDFRQNPITEKTIQNWLNNSTNLINKRSTTYRNLDDFAKQNIDKSLILDNITLIKRPVFILNDKILSGFKEVEFMDFYENNYSPA